MSSLENSLQRWLETRFWLTGFGLETCLVWKAQVFEVFLNLKTFILSCTPTVSTTPYFLP